MHFALGLLISILISCWINYVIKTWKDNNPGDRRLR